LIGVPFAVGALAVVVGVAALLAEAEVAVDAAVGEVLEPDFELELQAANAVHPATTTAPNRQTLADPFFCNPALETPMLDNL
jgi:hypothetical protein